jgi:hypothetical protein
MPPGRDDAEPPKVGIFTYCLLIVGLCFHLPRQFARKVKKFFQSPASRFVWPPVLVMCLIWAAHHCSAAQLLQAFAFAFIVTVIRYFFGPRISLWWSGLLAGNDPLNSELRGRGGRFFSEPYMPFVIWHLYWLELLKEKLANTFKDDLRHASLRFDLTRDATREAGVISIKKGRYLIFVTSRLFLSLYETFAELVRNPQFLPGVGTSDPREMLSSKNKITFDQACAAITAIYPDLEQTLGRVALLMVLVAFALDFVLIHEFAHVLFHDVDNFVPSQGTLRTADISRTSRPPELGDPDYGDFLIRYASELRCDEMAADFAFGVALLKPDQRSALTPTVLIAALTNNNENRSNCWLAAVLTLFVLLKPPDIYHPAVVSRVKKIIGVTAKQLETPSDRSEHDAAELLRDACIWRGKIGLCTNELERTLEDPELSGQAARLETAINAKDEADKFINDIFFDSLPSKSLISMHFARQAVDAMLKLHIVLLNIPGESAEAVTNSDQYRMMKKTAVYMKLVSVLGKEVSAVLGQRSVLCRLMEVPDFRYKLLLRELTKDLGIERRNLREDFVNQMLSARYRERT